MLSFTFRFRCRMRDVVRHLSTSPCTYEGELSQRTLIAFKPDTLQRGLLGELMQRFERRGLKLVGLKMLQPSRALVEEHYEEHRDRAFFERACVFVASGPVVASVWEGRGAIAAVRSLIGKTEPLDCAPGTIRGDFGAHWRRNLVHGSDSVESADREINLWFSPEELQPWEQATAPWLYELPKSKITWD
jgi:nucleoside-diphosphate kinase